MTGNAARIAINVPVAKGLYARIRSRAQHTGTPVEQIIATCLHRYLSASDAYKPLLTYPQGTVLTVLSCTLDAELVAKLHNAMPAHKPADRNATLNELIALAIDTDFKRQDSAANTVRAKMGANRQFKM